MTAEKPGNEACCVFLRHSTRQALPVLETRAAYPEVFAIVVPNGHGGGARNAVNLGIASTSDLVIQASQFHQPLPHSGGGLKGGWTGPRVRRLPIAAICRASIMCSFKSTKSPQTRSQDPRPATRK